MLVKLVCQLINVEEMIEWKNNDCSRLVKIDSGKTHITAAEKGG